MIDSGDRSASHDQRRKVKNINMRMTSNINDATYDRKTDQTTFAMSFFFILTDCCCCCCCCCGMENDTQCEPVIRSSDKSQKPAIGWNQVKHSLQLPRNGVRRSWYQYWSWQSWPWWSQWSWWSWHQYWAMVLQAETTTRQATGPGDISTTPAYVQCNLK